MKAIKGGGGGSIPDARRLEGSGDLAGAAAIYQRIVDRDALEEEASGRLLVLYRKMKEYKKELAVIDAILAAYRLREKGLQEAWIKAHPKAAGVGKAMLRQMGKVEGMGVGPAVGRLLKRREVVEGRVSGRKVKRKKGGGAARVAGKGREVEEKKRVAAEKRKVEAERRRVAVEERKRADAERKRVAAEKKMAANEKRSAEAENRRVEAEKRRVEAGKMRIAAEKKRVAAAEKKRPSLFVIILRYLVELNRIDAVMGEHVKFLERHYTAEHFVVSGRRVPRTGGVIIARGKSRGGVERWMRQDPFVKRKLASFDIIEFKASQKLIGL